MGLKVMVISNSPNKKEEALPNKKEEALKRLGADSFLVSRDQRKMQVGYLNYKLS